MSDTSDFDQPENTETVSAQPPRSNALIGSGRAEHLEWCKRRALEYCDAGDTTQAYTSMASDLGNHPETANHSAIQLGMMMLMSGCLSTVHEMRQFIMGFN